MANFFFIKYDCYCRCEKPDAESGDIVIYHALYNGEEISKSEKTCCCAASRSDLAIIKFYSRSGWFNVVDHENHADIIICSTKIKAGVTEYIIPFDNIKSKLPEFEDKTAENVFFNMFAYVLSSEYPHKKIQKFKTDIILHEDRLVNMENLLKKIFTAFDKHYSFTHENPKINVNYSFFPLGLNVIEREELIKELKYQEMLKLL